MAESLSPSDLAFIRAERGPVYMHVGGVLVFDGQVTREAVIGRLEERLHLIPRFRMRLESPPLGLANPVWIDDDGFDPARHVRRAVLPAPGGEAELLELVGHVLSERLDRSRPLWQHVVVEGLEGGRSAMVAKMHHALVDGIAAFDASTVVLDPTPEGLDLPRPEEPAATASGRSARVEQLARTAAAQLALPRRLARETVSRAFTSDPRAVAGQAREAAAVVTELARRRPAAPDTRLNRTIGTERLFATARARLDDVKTVRRAAGATVNDVLLGAVSLALSDFLGAAAPERAVALVPVSTRAEGEGHEVANRLATVFCDLPLRGEPLERVRRISAEMDRVKDSAQVRASALIAAATGLALPIVSSLAGRAMDGSRISNLVVSNVPGPRQTFYLAGVPLREVFPAAPLHARNQALSIGIVSYAGGVHFGLLADRDAVPDVADCAAALERGMGELVAAAGRV